jgi:hypothetical protein
MDFLDFKNQLISRALGEFYNENAILIGKFCTAVRIFQVRRKNSLFQNFYF